MVDSNVALCIECFFKEEFELTVDLSQTDGYVARVVVKMVNCCKNKS